MLCVNDTSHAPSLRLGVLDAEGLVAPMTALGVSCVTTRAELFALPGRCPVVCSADAFGDDLVDWAGQRVPILVCDDKAVSVPRQTIALPSRVRVSQILKALRAPVGMVEHPAAGVEVTVGRIAPVATAGWGADDDAPSEAWSMEPVAEPVRPGARPATNPVVGPVTSWEHRSESAGPSSASHPQPPHAQPQPYQQHLGAPPSASYPQHPGAQPQPYQQASASHPQPPHAQPQPYPSATGISPTPWVQDSPSSHPVVPRAPVAVDARYLDRDDDWSDVFSDPAAGGRRRRDGLSNVIVVWSGKGGTGKSSVSQALAAAAAEQGRRVVLVDGNVGQGGQRTKMTLRRDAAVRSILDAQTSPESFAYLSSPDMISRARLESLLEQPKFACVFAPPENMAEVVRPETYLRVVRELAAVSDLVVVDTQILEAIDGNGMRRGLVLPLFKEGAWGVGISIAERESMTNTEARLAWLAQQGVRKERMLVFTNAVSPKIGFTEEKVAARLSRYATYLGSAPHDFQLQARTNKGALMTPDNAPALANMVENILSRAIGTEVLHDVYDPHEKGSRGILGSLFGKRKG